MEQKIENYIKNHRAEELYGVTILRKFDEGILVEAIFIIGGCIHPEEILIPLNDL